MLTDKHQNLLDYLWEMAQEGFTFMSIIDIDQKGLTSTAWDLFYAGYFDRVYEGNVLIGFTITGENADA